MTTTLRRPERLELRPFNWSSQVIEDFVAKRNFDANATTYKVRNIWAMKDIGNTKNALKVTVAPHDVVMLRLIKA